MKNTALQNKEDRTDNAVAAGLMFGGAAYLALIFTSAYTKLNLSELTRSTDSKSQIATLTIVVGGAIGALACLGYGARLLTLAKKGFNPFAAWLTCGDESPIRWLAAALLHSTTLIVGGRCFWNIISNLTPSQIAGPLLLLSFGLIIGSVIWLFIQFGRFVMAGRS